MSDTHNTQLVLKGLGLNSNEGQIYLHLLKAGARSVQQISRSIGIPRSTIYQRIENLKQQELVIEERGEKGQIIRAVHPHKLKEITENRLQEAVKVKANIEKVVPELAAMFQPIATPSKVMHFEGVKGIQRLIMNYEMEAENKHICGYATDVMPQVLTHDFVLKKYHKKFLEKGYHDKFVISDAKENQDYFKSYKKLEVYKRGRIEVRVIDHKIFNPKVSVSIFDDKYAISLMKEGKPFGVIIQSEEVAQHQRELFNIVWEKAKEVKF